MATTDLETYLKLCVEQFLIKLVNFSQKWNLLKICSYAMIKWHKILTENSHNGGRAARTLAPSANNGYKLKCCG